MASKEGGLTATERAELGKLLSQDCVVTFATHAKNFLAQFLTETTNLKRPSVELFLLNEAKQWLDRAIENAHV
jgi:hypothetical protein